MANEEKQISDLTTGSITNDNDVFIMDTYEGVTVKIPYSVLKQTMANGITPSIDSTTKHWLIGSTDTNVVAEGQDGAQGQQGIQGNDGYSVSITATPITGGTRLTISSTDPEVSDETVDVMDGNAGGYVQGDGITISGSTISVNIGTGLDVDSQTGALYVAQTSSPITVSGLITLTTEGWDSTTMQQTVTFAHDLVKRNVIDITPAELPTWAASGVYFLSETAAGITFQCSTIPTTALTFRVTSMEVSA